MLVEELRQATTAQPFGRFTVELDDGRLLPVERPAQLGISPQGKELTYALGRGGFEHYPVAKVIRLLKGIVTKKAG